MASDGEPVPLNCLSVYSFRADCNNNSACMPPQRSDLAVAYLADAPATHRPATTRWPVGPPNENHSDGPSFRSVNCTRGAEDGGIRSTPNCTLVTGIFRSREVRESVASTLCQPHICPASFRVDNPATARELRFHHRPSLRRGGGGRILYVSLGPEPRLGPGLSRRSALESGVPIACVGSLADEPELKTHPRSAANRCDNPPHREEYASASRERLALSLANRLSRVSRRQQTPVARGSQ